MIQYIFYSPGGMMLLNNIRNKHIKEMRDGKRPIPQNDPESGCFPIIIFIGVVVSYFLF